jgi:hypothetical protein
VELGWMEVREDDDGLPFLLLLKNMEIIRQIFIFYNSERHLVDEKKMKIGEKCEMLIAKMIERAPLLPLLDIPNLRVIEGIPPKFTKCYNITTLIAEFKTQGIALNPDHLDDGKGIGIFGEVIMQDGQVLVETDFPKLQKMYPIIRFMNAVKKSNVEKIPAGAV